LQDEDWQMLTLALLRALSAQRLPALQEQFEGRKGIVNLASFVERIGFTVEELDALSEVLLLSA
jgi:hypothetical protein